jgi:uncharacterized protein YbjT (DUF2867 family)
MILITGARGTNGVELIRRLSAREIPVRAFVRDRTEAQNIALPGVDVVEGDFAQPQTFAHALDGVDRLFLRIPSSPEAETQQRNLVDAARRAGVAHIVKLSQMGADEYSPSRFQRAHAAVENYIRESGVAYTFLRPNLFMQSVLQFQSTIASQGTFYAAAGDAQISVVDVRDITAIAELTLTRTGHVDKAYTITGPEALTHAEMADKLSEKVGRRIAFVDIPPASMRQALLAVGIPLWRADGLVEEYELYRRGEAAKVTRTVGELTGARPRTFSQFAEDYADAFRAKDITVA